MAHPHPLGGGAPGPPGSAGGGAGGRAGPAGWFQAAQGWLLDSLDTLGNAATGPVQQVQLWELSCILRAPTISGDVWFKASRDSPLFVNEAVVARELAGLSPDHVPAPLAVNAERRWMALADFGPRLAAMCGELAAAAVPATLLHGDLHLGNVAKGPDGYLFFDWTDACIAHPFLDMITIFHEEDEALRDRLRDAYLAEWTRFAPPDRLRRAWELAEPLGALHHALSYRSIVANLDPPIDLHMMQSTAFWLRRVLAGLRQATAESH